MPVPSPSAQSPLLPPSPSHPSFRSSRGMSLLLRDSPFVTTAPTTTGYIDLTADTPPATAPTMMPRMRSISSNKEEPVRKRRRVNESSGPSIRSLLGPSLHTVDQVDLTKVDDDAGLKKLQEEQQVQYDRQVQLQQEQQQAKQQEESIRSLHEQSKKVTRISDLQCVVCMDNMTNITATHCGKPILLFGLDLATDKAGRPPVLPYLYHGSSHCR